jgi:AcrR family transcriptional regulator
MNDKKDILVIGVLKTFAQYGYRKTSMANLADVFGISRQALYKRFSNKELIFAWLVSEINATAISGMTNALSDSSLSIVERLVLGFDSWTGRYVDILRSSPHAGGIMDSGITIAKNNLEHGKTVADRIRILIARELVIEGIAEDLAEGERIAFVMYMGSKGLTLSAPDRNAYLEKIGLIVQTVIQKRY